MNRPAPPHPIELPARRFHSAALATAVVLMAAAAAMPSSASTLPGWHSELAAAQAKAREEGKLLLVDFFATWCGWCRTLEREVFPSAEFRQGVADLVLVRMDIEDPGEGSLLARRFQIRSVPAAVLLDADLVEVGRINGFSHAAAYLARIQRELAQYQELEGRYQRERALDDPEVLLALADELYRRGDGRRAGGLYQRLLEGWEGPRRAELFYRLADSRRLAGELEESKQVVSRALEELGGDAGGEVAQRLWLLRYRIAQEGGLCEEAARALETFLARYPTSGYAPPARRSLRELQEGLRQGAAECAG
jgi:thiol-disulfide isomerase/thioredoxin